ncbi:MAG: hypothetical protein FWF29_12795, partial [Treponema sp.]|nr:hypothetical protein [Treponema sp.]
IAPTGTKARKNLIVTDANNLQIVYRDTSTPAVAFADTIAWGANLRLVGYGQTPVYNPGTPDGIQITDPQMSKNADSLYMPSAQYSAYGMQPDGNSILKREDAGASFARGGVVK